MRPTANGNPNNVDCVQIGGAARTSDLAMSPWGTYSGTLGRRQKRMRHVFAGGEG
jgi:hypothetical protein